MGWESTSPRPRTKFDAQGAVLEINRKPMGFGGLSPRKRDGLPTFAFRPPRVSHGLSKKRSKTGGDPQGSRKNLGAVARRREEQSRMSTVYVTLPRSLEIGEVTFVRE